MRNTGSVLAHASLHLQQKQLHNVATCIYCPQAFLNQISTEQWTFLNDSGDLRLKTAFAHPFLLLPFTSSALAFCHCPSLLPCLSSLPFVCRLCWWVCQEPTPLCAAPVTSLGLLRRSKSFQTRVLTTLESLPTMSKSALPIAAACC